MRPELQTWIDAYDAAYRTHLAEGRRMCVASPHDWAHTRAEREANRIVKGAVS